ncbi:hypothetical protein ASAP_2879 [Asaia bogorensis]|uniref:Uncharacterized protein n=1 Tax=Asaia bogorensis TaxID=91915 RepID=A0A060QID0_9PROT|nr:hypothetical protein ASAP_2879 [Asaia bogorensis]
MISADRSWFFFRRPLPGPVIKRPDNGNTGLEACSGEAMHQAWPAR